MCLKSVAVSFLKSLDYRIIIHIEFLSLGESYIPPIISVSQIVLRGNGGNRKFCWGDFLLSGRNLIKSDSDYFDYSYLFQR